eukprot:gene6316-6388_t
MVIKKLGELIRFLHLFETFFSLARNYAIVVVTLSQPFAYPDPKSIPKAKLGGMTIAVTTRAAAAQHLVDAAKANRGRMSPYYFTSANGQVLSLVAAHPEVRALFETADLVHADGQSIYLAAQRLKFTPMPERVATTDLVHDVARIAAENGLSFFILGAQDDVNMRACKNLQMTYPGLNIVGRHHGYFSRDYEAELVNIINAAKPDILWVSMGVPLEQDFIVRNKMRLYDVGVIKTSGGLLDFLSNDKKQPGWSHAALAPAI